MQAASRAQEALRFHSRCRTIGTLLTPRFFDPPFLCAAIGITRRHSTRRSLKLSLRQNMAASTSPRPVKRSQKRITSGLQDVKISSDLSSRARAYPAHHVAAIAIETKAITWRGTRQVQSPRCFCFNKPLLSCIPFTVPPREYHLSGKSKSPHHREQSSTAHSASLFRY